MHATVVLGENSVLDVVISFFGCQMACMCVGPQHGTLRTLSSDRSSFERIDLSRYPAISALSGGGEYLRIA